ncbi:MAG: hypothetical protein IC227_10300 [Enterococcus lacertideformus]|uniref:Lipoprotein n=1 Tax=Enterococcus lacertideformus TaxID=2771493 RepID=A0A931AX92_9ENTE|nr:hypothetical protein [Enterococcus lacertideformus]
MKKVLLLLPIVLGLTACAGVENNSKSDTESNSKTEENRKENSPQYLS